jgi:hypothetical protein
MREYFTYGSVRGVAGNGGPYRVHDDVTRTSGARPFWASSQSQSCSALALLI